MNQLFATHIVSNKLCVHCKRFNTACNSHMAYQGYEKRETDCTFAQTYRMY
jgi:hypothetical protein